MRSAVCFIILSVSPLLAADHPALFAQRATADSREAARRTAGFPAGTSEAVKRALRQLHSKKNRDGSWGNRSRVASTSLALLAFLADGHSPLSEEYGESITGALIFLVDTSVRGRGKLGADPRNPQWPLHHALGTQALAESYLLCHSQGVQIPGQKKAILVAAQWIIDNAHEKGGWALSFDGDGQGSRGGDLGMTVPLLHALWLAHQCGIETRNAKQTVGRALDLLEQLQIETGAVKYAVAAHRPGYPMTGGSAFIHQVARRSDNQLTRQALAFLASEAYRPVPFRESPSMSDLHSFHYDALAMMHGPPEHRDKWFAQPVTELLSQQRADGSFAPQTSPPGERSKDSAIQRGSLACLILQTPWRYQLEK